MNWKEAKEHPKYETIMRVFKYYSEQINPWAELRPSEVIKIGERLDEFGEKKLMEAINKFKSSSWWLKKHSFRYTGWFFKSEQIKRFLKIKSDAEWDRDYYYRTGYEIVR